MESKMKLLKPQINPSTLSDNRGGIFTYFPITTEIKEWSYIVTHKGVDRGHHSHPEFDEYILMVEGHGCYLEKTDSDELVHLIGPGDCIFIPCGSNHTFKPLEDCRMVALLTKKWDDCCIPIVRDK